ncbi:putative ABC transport system permease protein [Filimonas lacunae]|uniref:Putative ABC transport system permease protein n=1 Tax=Filimonas lacunae TaxID=477680 RepID=A0A173MDL6_9BACT|nr:ABC transporter permease [Filimonas lacunae]BAV05620.1 ABC transporter, permease protein [Filimonas lacunae]SIT29169.1 putative ABC transport system permease protein [Filimonas lacunae]
MLRNYITTSVRNLFRNKAYAFINIGGLSLGLACAILIILYVKDEVSYDRFHRQAGQIYRVDREITRENGNKVKGGYSGYLQGPRFKASISEIAAFVRVQETQVDIKRGSNIQTQKVSRVDTNFFSVFNFPLLSGTPGGLKEPRSVVITEDMAKAQFGTTDAVGKTMLLNVDGFVPYVVTAVAANCPQNSSIKFQVLLPLNMAPEEENKNENWFSFFLNTFVVLYPHADVKAVDAKMQQVFETDARQTIISITQKYNLKNLGLSYFLQSLTDIHLSKEAGANEGLSDGSEPIYSYALSGIAFFILLIACINFVNLTLARSLKRAKEIGIRKVIGGQRNQLVLQFLGESFMLCLASFVLAIVIAQALLPVFNRLSNKALSFSYLLDTKLFLGYIALFLVTGLLAGFYPALVLSNYQPVKILYGRFMPAGKNWLQKSLVVFQFVLASFFIVATFTLFFQLNYLSSQQLGYDDSNLVMVSNLNMSTREIELFERELLKNPVIQGVAPKNSGTSGTTVKVNGGTKINIAYETVNSSYLPLLKIPIVEGRNFLPDFPADSSHSVLVNETFVKEAGWKTPIGQTIHIYEPAGDFIVVGVVKDHHYKALTEKIEPQLFRMSSADGFLGMFYIKIAAHDNAKSLAYIEAAFKKVFPLAPYSYHFKDQVNAESYDAEKKWKEMLQFGALLIIFISCIGLFGLSVLSMEKRAKEIGIRKVLGASVRGVATILSGDFLKLIFIALLISTPLSWLAANRWLENYPYRITMSWWMFALAGFIVLFIAMLTVSFHAIKAGIANPVRSLRSQ